MRFGTRVLPTVGLLTDLRPAGREDHHSSPPGRTRDGSATWPTPVLAVLDDRAPETPIRKFQT